MGLLLTCERVTALLTDYHEGVLSWSLAWRVRGHLAACGSCRELDEELLGLGGVVQRELGPAISEGTSPAAEALRAVLARLGREEGRPVPAEGPIPAPLVPLLKGGTDEPLRLQAMAHQYFHSVLPREGHPLLPQEVVAEMPPAREWIWRNQGAARVAEILRDEARGSRLSLVYAPRGTCIPIHRHHGTESMLLLDGDMVDERGAHATGDWLFYEEGSLHAPRMGEDGCWCLVREEGVPHFEGPLGWLRNLLAA